jgi:hypothetical protein
MQLNCSTNYRTQRNSAGFFRALNIKQLGFAKIAVFSIPRYRAGFCNCLAKTTKSRRGLTQFETLG